ncbi:YceI family protein [Asticcacaulis sp. ZE23SCel15]|uniref:YceI family protein n=1 Tax=Asticcacaulis sp. ZE23SCel15 TaxID=3059027 RepID=UPI00265E22F1|nr:YceI family protein [Asticcacaulis sp. ZE23SCel15]WKL56766.1 YceI family protein [Asticcacaulis sp. ZE23SCel15]
MPIETYNRYSRWLHWLIAGLIIFMIILGWRLEDEDAGRFARFQLHKSIGITILFLSFIRLGLRFAYKAPPEVDGPKWQMAAAKAVHWGFYVAMIGLPLTGWAMVSASPMAIKTVLYGIMPWPHLPVPASEQAHDAWEAAHGILAKLITYVLIPLHIGAALKHHVIDKDNTITRMVPGLTPKPLLNWRWIIPAATVGIAIISGALIFGGAKPETPPTSEAVTADVAPVEGIASSSEASEMVSAVAASEMSSLSVTAPAVTKWTVDKAKTRLDFLTSFQGANIRGRFSDYSADIRFDPVALETSSIKVVINLNSVSTDDTERDNTLKSDSFFNVASHPKATFEAKSFTKISETRFVAKGKLTLHGQTKSFDLPFNLKITEFGVKKVANVTAQADLDRLGFGVGSGDWASTDQIPADVKLDFTLSASAVK